MSSPAFIWGHEPFTPHAAGEPERVAGFPALRLADLHRGSLTNVLVLGGTRGERERVARTFHASSPVHRGAFVVVDCENDAPSLLHALATWLDVVGEEPAQNPLGGAERGTLFLDSPQLLPLRTQRLLLAFVRRIQDGPLPGLLPYWTGRLVVGAPTALEQAVHDGSFLRPLFDCLDKVRVDLDHTPDEEASWPTP